MPEKHALECRRCKKVQEWRVRDNQQRCENCGYNQFTIVDAAPGVVR